VPRRSPQGVGGRASSDINWRIPVGELLAKDEGIAEADTLLLTVPNQLGVAYNVHVIESILRHIAPRPRMALTLGSVAKISATV